MNQLALVIKRTWGLMREEVLQICSTLEQHSINILNGCDAIAWRHSKTKQYQSLQHTGLIPESYCFEPQEIEKFTPENLSKVTSCLPYPMIFKSSKGSRSEGIFYVESPGALKKFVQEFISSNKYKIYDGFLLQKINHNCA